MHILEKRKSFHSKITSILRILGMSDGVQLKKWGGPADPQSFLLCSPLFLAPCPAHLDTPSSAPSRLLLSLCGGLDGRVVSPLSEITALLIPNVWNSLFVIFYLFLKRSFRLEGKYGSLKKNMKILLIFNRERLFDFKIQYYLVGGGGTLKSADSWPLAYRYLLNLTLW